MSSSQEKAPRSKSFHILLIAFTTASAILVSIICLGSGSFIVFQNLFYIPIVLSCMYDPKRGFIYSLGLAGIYLLLVLAFAPGAGIVAQALVRFVFFAGIAGVVAALSWQRKQAGRELAENGQAFQRLFEESTDPIFLMDAKGFVDCNPACTAILGYASKEEIIGKLPSDLSPRFQPDGTLSTEKGTEMAELARANGHHNFEWIHLKSDGTEFPVDVMMTPIVVRGEPLLHVVWRDITARKLAERRQGLSTEILGILNDERALLGVIPRILAAVREETDIDAVGIRLKRGNDFPYYAQEGFSEGHAAAENSLLAMARDGGFCRDERGAYCLECTCGLVLSGNTDPSSPYFTEGGSFWTNDSLALLDLPADKDPRFNPRNSCMYEGFLSLALIPFRVNNEIMGLLQMNHRKKDRFTPEMIRFFEGISASIAVALVRMELEEEREKLILDLKEALSQVKVLSGLLPICSSCKRIRDDKGYWEQMEAYIGDHSDAEFTHCLCPECAERLYPEYYEKK